LIAKLASSGTRFNKIHGFLFRNLDRFQEECNQLLAKLLPKLIAA
jgi:hypothetical protein